MDKKNKIALGVCAALVAIIFLIFQFNSAEPKQNQDTTVLTGSVREADGRSLAEDANSLDDKKCKEDMSRWKPGELVPQCAKEWVKDQQENGSLPEKGTPLKEEAEFFKKMNIR